MANDNQRRDDEGNVHFTVGPYEFVAEAPTELATFITSDTKLADFLSNTIPNFYAPIPIRVCVRLMGSVTT